MSEDHPELDQQDVVAFLRNAANWTTVPCSDNTDGVTVFETHGAFVFLHGTEALKIKRAVKLAYLDFSTLDRRRRVCERELALNQPAAPDIYLGLVPIVRLPDGQLSIGGKGEAVEWAVRMVRFDQSCLMNSVASRGELHRALALDLADMVAAMHESAPVAQGLDTAARLSGVANSICDTLARQQVETPTGFASALSAAIERNGPLLKRRSEAGLVRRCHGDLHLGNIVLWKGKPLPFDAIEFDETIATVDTLYDLAFLLMDLERHRCTLAANAVLNRYLLRSQRLLDLEGLAALPLFLGLRAGVRAMVNADRLAQQSGEAQSSTRGRVLDNVARASSYLAPPPPCLVAVGGLSGTGKSTLAAALAPSIGPSPGAVHLRSDSERKVLAGVAETDRLPAESYTEAGSATVYDTLLRKARIVLAAGHGVIVDAVHARAAERDSLEALARELGIAFHGIWLEAPPAMLKQRVTARRHDASDATAEVVDRQLRYDLGLITWQRIEAAGDAAATLDAARRGLGSV